MEDGRVQIEVLKRDENGILFRFVSFPDVLRGRMDFEIYGWEVCSEDFPEVMRWDRILFCPGRIREQDESECYWEGEESLLRTLIRMIDLAHVRALMLGGKR